MTPREAPTIDTPTKTGSRIASKGIAGGGEWALVLHGDRLVVLP